MLLSSPEFLRGILCSNYILNMGKLLLWLRFDQLHVSDSLEITLWGFFFSLLRRKGKEFKNKVLLIAFASCGYSLCAFFFS